MKKFDPYSIEIDGSFLAGKLNKDLDDGTIVAWPSREQAIKVAIAKYEKDVYELLELINTPGGIGPIILNALPPGKKVTIMPKAVAKGAGVNVTSPDDPANAGPAPDPRDPQHRPVPGSAGKGSDSTIQFGPGVQSGCGVQAGQNAQCIAQEGDEVLFHELVHALRMAQGKLSKTTFNETGKLYGDTEEFWAILLTNIYISGNGGERLRRDHDSTDAKLPKQWSTSKGFLSDSDNARLVKEFCTFEEKPIAERIAKLTSAKFNPIKEFMTGVAPR